MSEEITKKIRVNSISLASGPPYESVNVGYQVLEGLQQFSGNMVVSKQELVKLNVTVGDELFLKLARVEK